MSKTSSSQDFPDLPPRSLLTVVEAADFFRVSGMTIYRWADAGIIRTVKHGGVRRVPVAEIMRIFSATTAK